MMTSTDITDRIAIASEHLLKDVRDALFSESPAQRASRWALGIAYACKPQRIADIPRLATAMAVEAWRGGTVIPDQKRTWSRPDTFGGICRSISPETVLAAARIGFFPWCHCEPLKWWTREKRMVLFFDEHHISKRLRAMMRNSGYRVTFDTAFDEVIQSCAQPRLNRTHTLTWITPKIMRLYSSLHQAGHAHSVEVWNREGQLVGGSYGLVVGRIFVTESQFFREPNASKIGYHVLNYHLAQWGFVLNDNKGWTEATASMGFREIPRAEYEAILATHAVTDHKTGPWRPEASLEEVSRYSEKPAVTR